MGLGVERPLAGPPGVVQRKDTANSDSLSVPPKRIRTGGQGLDAGRCSGPILNFLTTIQDLVLNSVSTFHYLRPDFSSTYLIFGVSRAQLPLGKKRKVVNFLEGKLSTTNAKDEKSRGKVGAQVVKSRDEVEDPVLKSRK